MHEGRGRIVLRHICAASIDYVVRVMHERVFRFMHRV